MRYMLAIAALSLTACHPPVVKPDPEPVQLTCAPQAKEQCQTQPPLWQPDDPNSPDAWKLLLPQVLLPMSRELSDCDRRLRAAQACLDAAQEQKLIIWR